MLLKLAAGHTEVPVHPKSNTGDRRRPRCGHRWLLRRPMLLEDLHLRQRHRILQMREPSAAAASAAIAPTMCVLSLAGSQSAETCVLSPRQRC
jgi:hypothetical protein